MNIPLIYRYKCDSCGDRVVTRDERIAFHKECESCYGVIRRTPAPKRESRLMERR